MFFIGLALFSLCAALGESIDWKERTNSIFQEPDNELDKIRCLDSSEKLCRNGQDETNNLIENVLKKKSYNIVDMLSNARNIPIYQSAPQCPCLCKLEYSWKDLGRNFFPRYLRIGACTPGSCGRHHECVEKKYIVTVIKQRDYSDQDIPETKGLPKNLQDTWVSQSLNVSMACECLPNI